MKIALIGYGKMGKAIEEIALERGHEIVLKISSENSNQLTSENISKADVAIEFSTPSLAFNNVKFCIEHGVAVVCGTTAWLDQLPEVHALVKDKNGSFIYGSNFSLGVNLFFAINEYVAKILNDHKVYKTTITEIHHTAKLDAPSGTAITLAEGILSNNASLNKWVKGFAQHEKELPILSERIDPAPGTHIVSYASEIDTIEIKHEAHTRKGFATGAVIAAEWLQHKKGIFSMKDVLGL
jgi:4-hydroxy-tetrahydrodipicolinate reductase